MWEDPRKRPPPREREWPNGDGERRNRWLLAREREVGIGLDCANRGGRGHQVVVPLVAVDLDVCRRAEQDRLDEVVVEVHVQAGLVEGVERCARRTAADEPG